LNVIARTSTNLVIETTIAYGATERHFGGIVARIVAFGTVSIGVKARANLCFCGKDVAYVDDEKCEWYRGGHGEQREEEAGEWMELRLQGCINLFRPAWMIAAETLSESSGTVDAANNTRWYVLQSFMQASRIHISIDEASPAFCYWS
jgi:hypothetical protein